MGPEKESRRNSSQPEEIQPANPLFAMRGIENSGREVERPRQKGGAGQKIEMHDVSDEKSGVCERHSREEARPKRDAEATHEPMHSPSGQSEVKDHAPRERQSWRQSEKQ